MGCHLRTKEERSYSHFARESSRSSKHEVSRWFKGDPNWTINTIASIAHALKLTLVVQAIDEHGNVYGASGKQASATIATSDSAMLGNPTSTSDLALKPVIVTRNPPGSSMRERPDGSAY